VLLPTFRQGRACWEQVIDTSAGRFVRVQVPYEDTSLPGYLLRPDASGAASGLTRAARRGRPSSSPTEAMSRCPGCSVTAPPRGWPGAGTFSCTTAPGSSRCCSSGGCRSAMTGRRC
jgi:hypothetical protein